MNDRFKTPVEKDTVVNSKHITALKGLGFFFPRLFVPVFGYGHLFLSARLYTFRGRNPNDIHYSRKCTVKVETSQR